MMRGNEIMLVLIMIVDDLLQCISFRYVYAVS